MEKILTPSGYVNLSDVKIGDEVIGLDGINTIETISIWDENYDVDNQGSFTFYKINNRWNLYKNQSVMAGGRVVHAFEVNVGDNIVLDDKSEITVDTIEESTDVNWYRFNISGDSTYFVDNLLLHNASRYWVGAGSSTNWNATSNTNWGATSGGVNNQSVPASSDDVIFDGAGGGNGASTISAGITILSLSFTIGYTNTVTINSSPTIAGNFTDQTQHTWAGSAGLYLSGTVTITSNGKTFPNAVYFTGTATKTLVGNWIIQGVINVNGTTTLNWTTNETLSCAGIYLPTDCLGTAKIILTGGQWTSVGGALRNNLDIAGNVNLNSSNLYYYSGIFTYVSGTVTYSNNNTMQFLGSCTLNTNGINFNNVLIPNASTVITINSLLIVTGNFTISSGVSPTFSGTAGFNVANFINNNNGTSTVTLKNGVQYIITTSMACYKSLYQSILTFTSDDGTIKAKLKLNQGATCNVLANFTRIDASGGRSINSFNGIITNCININSFNDLKTIGIIY